MTIAPAEAVAQPPTLPYDAPPADILDAAAQVIETNGRHVGNYYEFLLELDTRRASEWRPGTPCCAAGAIGVAIGLRRPWDIESHIVPAATMAARDDELPHPAFAALMAHLGTDSIETVFTWSDDHGAGEIASVMRECAAKLRVAS